MFASFSYTTSQLRVRLLVAILQSTTNAQTSHRASVLFGKHLLLAFIWGSSGGPGQNRIGAPSIQAAWLHRGNRRCAIALGEEVMRSRTNLLMTTVILLTAGTAGAYAADKDEMIKNAMSAAPRFPRHTRPYDPTRRDSPPRVQ